LTEDDNSFEAELKFNADTLPQQILMMSIDNDNSNNEMIISFTKIISDSISEFIIEKTNIYVRRKLMKQYEQQNQRNQNNGEEEKCEMILFYE